MFKLIYKNKNLLNFNRNLSDLSVKKLQLNQTFGDLEKLSNAKKSHYEKDNIIKTITENDSYKSFFQDFAKSNTEAKTRITSFEEQKSFKQVFDYLSQDNNKIGVVNSLKDFVGLKSPVENVLNIDNINEKNKNGNISKENHDNSNKTSKISFFRNEAGAINLEIQYENKLIKNKKLLDALSPTLKYINSNLNNSEKIYDFVLYKVLKKFVEKQDSLKNPMKINHKIINQSNNNEKASLQKLNSIEKINELSLKSPENPSIDSQTLPILLKYCLNSLTFNFNSISLSLLLVEYIKNHKSIELYGYGLNIDVYNSILFQIWSKTENLKLIGHLIDELNVNAIQPDLQTYKILSKIYLHCMRAKDNGTCEPYLLWCDSSDIHKIKDYLQNIRFL